MYSSFVNDSIPSFCCRVLFYKIVQKNADFTFSVNAAWKDRFLRIKCETETTCQTYRDVKTAPVLWKRNLCLTKYKFGNHLFKVTVVQSFRSNGQGCQVGPFWAKFQKFGPKYHLLAPKFSFGPLALFWPISRIDWPLARIFITKFF